MKYFLIALIFFVLFASVGLFRVWSNRLKKRFFFSAFYRAVLQNRAKDQNISFASGYIITACASLILKTPIALQKSFSTALKQKNIQPVLNFLKQKNPDLALGFEAHFEPEKAFAEALARKKQNNSLYLDFVLSVFNARRQDMLSLSTTLDGLFCRLKGDFSKAYYYLLAAQVDVWRRDYEAASKKYFRALDLFKKENLFFDQAECYLALGEMYRVSGYFDQALSMFWSAREIYDSFSDDEGKAKVLSALGMLELAQSDFKAALKYFNQSEKIYNKLKHQAGLAGLKNQKSWLYYNKHQYSLAQKNAQKAFDLYRKINNPHGMALSRDLLARAYFQKKNFEKAYGKALKAENYFKKNNDTGAFYDVCFLRIHILFAQKKYKEAQKLCRILTKFEAQNKLDFYQKNLCLMKGHICRKLNQPQKAEKYFAQISALDSAKCGD